MGCLHSIRSDHELLCACAGLCRYPSSGTGQAPGGRRIFAAVPLLLMVPIFAYTINLLHQGSNLWPVLLIFATHDDAIHDKSRQLA